MGTACTGGYNGVRAVRPESVAGGGWFGMSRRIKPKEKYARISMKEILRIWTVRRKIKNCGATCI